MTDDKRCSLSTPTEPGFAQRLRSNAAFLASNYNDLSADEAQVLVRALESAADHVAAYFASVARSESTPSLREAIARHVESYRGQMPDAVLDVIATDIRNFPHE